MPLVDTAQGKLNPALWKTSRLGLCWRPHQELGSDAIPAAALWVDYVPNQVLIKYKAEVGEVERAENTRTRFGRR